MGKMNQTFFKHISFHKLAVCVQKNVEFVLLHGATVQIRHQWQQSGTACELKEFLQFVNKDGWGSDVSPFGGFHIYENNAHFTEQ